MTRTDLGERGTSSGDLTIWWANVHAVLPASRNPADSPIVGIASGFNVTASPYREMGDGLEHEYRVSTFHLEWFGTEDEVCRSGLHDYANTDGPLINACRRPIIGGTGWFLGRAGVARVAPLGDDWFRVDLYLVDRWRLGEDGSVQRHGPRCRRSPGGTSVSRTHATRSDTPSPVTALTSRSASCRRGDCAAAGRSTFDIARIVSPAKPSGSAAHA